jgi:hypothetical protein
MKLTVNVKAAQTKFGDHTATNDITFILDVSDARHQQILGDSLKVAFRNGKNREIAWKNNGKPITVYVNDQGMSVVDAEAAHQAEMALRREQITRRMTSGQHNAEEIMALVEELKAISK